MRPIQNIFFAIVISGFFGSCSTGTFSDETAASGPYVRVCLAEKLSTVDVRTNGSIIIKSAGYSQSFDGAIKLTCSLSSSGAMIVSVDGKKVTTVEGVFRCYPQSAGTTFEYEGRLYSDTLVFAGDGSSFFLVNILPVESYLQSVVPNEIGRNRKQEEFEALKAQAVIARTYTIAKIQLPLKRLFDVYDDSRDQVFDGHSGQSPLTTDAVRATWGEVLSYEGKYAECYFHSTCGGNTEAVSLVWQRPQSKPYLRGVSDFDGVQSYCSISPSFRWSELYSRTDLEALLRTYIPSASDQYTAADFPEKDWHLLDLRILKRMPSGRIAILKIVMGNTFHQKRYYLQGDKIRWAFRRGDASSILRSTRFDIYIERDNNRWIRNVRINGGGNGHGVGLCQWGAIGRAKMGQSYKDILRSYFPDTIVQRDY